MRCSRCERQVSHSSGIVCANFGWPRGKWAPCRQAWHAQCYEILENDPFPSALRPKSQTKEGEIEFENAEGSEPEAEAVATPPSRNYVVVRKGDHLMCPFQCDLCHFRNIKGCDPLPTLLGDIRLQIAIRRAILDSFWARTTKTVEGNLSQVSKFLVGCNYFSVELPFAEDLPRGPFPLKDTWGMLAACVFLQRSLSAGKNSDTVQFSTVRRIQTAVSNYSNASPSGLGLVSVTSDRHKQRFTSGPTTSDFFGRFTIGCHCRMGDVVIRDRAMTIDVLQALLRVLNLEFAKASDKPKLRFEIVTLGACLCFSFSAAIRGEEIAFCLLGATSREMLTSLIHPRLPHAIVTLRGTFKGVQGIREHRFPLALVSDSGVLENKVWLIRLMLEYFTLRKIPAEGPLFRKTPTKAKPMKISQLDTLLHKYLGAVQASSPEVLDPQVDVEQEYSFRRSLRRGSTTHARNRGVPADVVDFNNRWRKIERAGNRDPSLSMLDTYTDALASLDLVIQYSQSF